MIIDKIAYKYININVLQTINLCYLCLIETLKNQIMKNVIKNTKKGILMVTMFAALLSFANEPSFYSIKNYESKSNEFQRYFVGLDIKI